MQSIYLTIALAPLVAADHRRPVRPDHRPSRRAQHHHRGRGTVLRAVVLRAVSDPVRGHGALTTATVYTWLVSDGLTMEVGFLIDRLSAMMMVVVTFVSLMVHIYTIGYMHDDDGYQRFFSYISLFTFSMLMLVMSNNFMQLFFGWEAVGVVSYLLIGFWYTRPTAIFANLKAFLVNRVGDFGFVLGIAAVLRYTGSLDYATVFAHAEPDRRGADPHQQHGDAGRRSPSPAFACSSAPWASPRRCRCTCGCRIPWKARRRFRR